MLFVFGSSDNWQCGKLTCIHRIFKKKISKQGVFNIFLVIDIIGLLYLTLGKFLNFEFNINLRNLHIVLCKLTMPMAYSIPPISAYITVMISFDRWLTIAKPTVLVIRIKKIFRFYLIFKSNRTII